MTHSRVVLIIALGGYDSLEGGIDKFCIMLVITQS